MMSFHQLAALSEADFARLADEIAFFLQPGDLIALEGELGAGKTTFARALIRSLTGDASLEVPSPTFTLVQTYETPRFEVAHLDLYRLSDPNELDELGLEAARGRGVVIVEWPERGGERVTSAERLTLRFKDAASADSRDVMLTATPSMAGRLQRFLAIRRFLADSGWGAVDTRVSYFQGDASPRRYARLVASDGTSAILMDSPARPDGPAIRSGKSYSAIAHLAEDVRPFVAISAALRERGFAAPRIQAADIDNGLLVTDDLGDRVYSGEVVRGADQARLWREATDVLVALRQAPPSECLTFSGGDYVLPIADQGVLEIETELLLDWYWPAANGSAPDAEARQSFREIWQDIFARVLAGPKGWLLRDYHSPNLMELDGDVSHSRVGIIDFQDAMIGPQAYDLVSLLQDARVDVLHQLETELFEHYVARVMTEDPEFDATKFRFAYAALGAQRNTKILGIFARLAMRDGKRQYLVHIPRIWGYLERDLKHPDLNALAAWYDRHLPRSRRANLNI